MAPAGGKRIFAAALAAFALLAFPAGASAAYMRIISLYPGHTDNIVALGASDRLVGISKNDEPDLLPELPRFSPSSGAEALLALQPDLVLTRTLADRQNPELKKILERAGVKVALIDPPSWDGFSAYIGTLAGFIGSDRASAEGKLESIKEEIRAAAKRVSKGRRPRVFVEATAKELHTCSPDSWAANLVELAGGINAAGGAKPVRKGGAIAPWGLERILQTVSGGLDVYLVQQGTMNGTDIEDLRSRAWYPALERVKTAVIPERYLSRPSLTGLERGGLMLVNIFYGE